MQTVQKRYSRENVTGVANKLAGGEAGVEVPETESLVPRRGESELAVRRDDNVGDEVVVAVEDLLGETERRLVTRELPDDDGLVCESQSLSPYLSPLLEEKNPTHHAKR